MKSELFPFSIILQVKATSTASYLRTFAVYVHGRRDQLASSVEEKDALRAIITDLLTVSISQTDLFQGEQPGPSQYPRYAYSTPALPALTPVLAFQCITQCLDCGNEPLAKVVVEKLVSTLRQDAAATQKRATLVLLPLLPLLSDDFKKRTPPPTLPLKKLAEAAIPLYLDSVAATGSLTQDKVAAMLKAVSLAGVPDLITSL